MCHVFVLPHEPANPSIPFIHTAQLIVFNYPWYNETIVNAKKYYNMLLTTRKGDLCAKFGYATPGRWVYTTTNLDSGDSVLHACQARHDPACHKSLCCAGFPIPAGAHPAFIFIPESGSH